MDQLDTYLDILFDGLTGLVYSPVKTIEGNWETHWFEYPTERQRLREHIESKVGDVYLSLATYNERRATKDSIKKLQVAWAEYDGQERIDFKQVPIPSAIVQTSSASHVHCYWRIDPNNQGAVEDINRRLTYYLGADNTGWDATQLLRPPGTTNWKHNLPVFLADSSGGKYELSTFEHVPEVKSTPVEITDVKELLSLQEVLKKHTLPLKLLKMIKKEEPDKGARSSFLAKLALELAEEEFNHTEIVSLLRHADERVGKYSGRADQLKRLSQLADFAIIKTVAEDEVVVYTPEYVLSHVESLQWILPNWLHTHGMMIVAGAPNIGKTQFIMQMAYCLSEGERFLGYQAPTKQKVMVWSLEMDIRSLKYIMEHQREEWNHMPEFLIIDEEASWTRYEDLIDQNNVNVVMVDSLTELHDESADNANTEARRIMRWCRKVRRRYNVAIILIHHTRKPTEGNKRPNKLSDFIGSQDIGRVVETGLMLWEDSKGIELSAVKARFAKKGPVGYLDRNKNLWYTRRENASENDQRSESDQERDKGQQGNSDRHRDVPDGTSDFKGSFRFGR